MGRTALATLGNSPAAASAAVCVAADGKVVPPPPAAAAAAAEAAATVQHHASLGAVVAGLKRLEQKKRQAEHEAPPCMYFEAGGLIQCPCRNLFVVCSRRPESTCPACKRDLLPPDKQAEDHSPLAFPVGVPIECCSCTAELQPLHVTTSAVGCSRCDARLAYDATIRGGVALSQLAPDPVLACTSRAPPASAPTPDAPTTLNMFNSQTLRSTEQERGAAESAVGGVMTILLNYDPNERFRNAEQNTERAHNREADWAEIAYWLETGQFEEKFQLERVRADGTRCEVKDRTHERLPPDFVVAPSYLTTEFSANELPFEWLGTNPPPEQAEAQRALPPSAAADMETEHGQMQAQELGSDNVLATDCLKTLAGQLEYFATCDAVHHHYTAFSSLAADEQQRIVVRCTELMTKHGAVFDSGEILAHSSMDVDGDEESGGLSGPLWTTGGIALGWSGFMCVCREISVQCEKRLFAEPFLYYK